MLQYIFASENKHGEVFMRMFSGLFGVLLLLTVTTAYAQGDSSQIEQDKIQVDKDKHTLQAEREKLRQDSITLQHDRKKMLEDEYKLQTDQGLNPKRGFWHGQHNTITPAQPVTPPPAPAPAEKNSTPSDSPMPTEMQDQTPTE
jgi:hypothetical protein